MPINIKWLLCMKRRIEMKNSIEQRREKALKEMEKDFNDYYFGGAEEKAMYKVNQIRQQELALDKAFEYIVHELRRRELLHASGYYLFEHLISPEEFTIRYLEKVEEGL
jgi:hypothetical protein